MEFARLDRGALRPGRVPLPGRAGGGAPDPHLGRLPGRRLRLQDQEARRPGLPRLQHAGRDGGTSARRRSASTAGWPRDVYLGVVPVTRARPGTAGGGRWRGRRVGGEDGAPAGRSHAPKPPSPRGEVGVGVGGGLWPARSPPSTRQAESGPGGRRLRPLRGGGPQRPRELRAGRRPRRHHRQPSRLRPAAGAHGSGPGRPPHLIEERAERGVPRDTHGDLRLDHVYLFPDRRAARTTWSSSTASSSTSVSASPTRWPTWPSWSWTSRSTAGATWPGRSPTPISGPRATARAGRCCPSTPPTGRPCGARWKASSCASRRSRGRAGGGACQGPGYWLLALGELEEPGRKPCLVLVGGLPGTGKSTLARALAERPASSVIRSDVVRKELADAGRAWNPVPSAFGEGMYAAEWTERTYAECLRRAEACVFEGRRAILDGSFRQERYRQLCLQAARRWGVPAAFFLCWAEPELVRGRLENRRGDASDADWAVHQAAAASWEAASAATQPFLREIGNSAGAEQACAQALSARCAMGLAT